MRNLFMGLCGAGIAVVLAGCQPELAQTREGAREAQWREMIGESYSGYRPPRTAPPAIRDNVSPELVEREQQTGSEAWVDDSAAPLAGEEIYYEEEAVIEETAPAPADDAVEPDAAVAADEKAAAVTEEAAVAGENGAAPAAADAAVGDEKEAQATDETVEYVVKAGDTLSHIAKKFYGKASFADLIWKANTKAVPDPNRLKPGTKLQIPKL